VGTDGLKAVPFKKLGLIRVSLAQDDRAEVVVRNGPPKQNQGDGAVEATSPAKELGRLALYGAIERQQHDSGDERENEPWGVSGCHQPKVAADEHGDQRAGNADQRGADEPVGDLPGSKSWAHMPTIHPTKTRMMMRKFALLGSSFSVIICGELRNGCGKVDGDRQAENSDAFSS